LRLPAGGDAGLSTVGDTSHDASGEFGDGAPATVTTTVNQGRLNGDHACDHIYEERTLTHDPTDHDEESTDLAHDRAPGPEPYRSTLPYGNEDSHPTQDASPQHSNTQLNGGREGRNEHDRQRRAKNRLRRAHVHLATLNMKGRNSVVDGVITSKWGDIENMMKTRRIGILAVQETHLTPEDVEDLMGLHQRRLIILNSADPERPTQSAGVAFVVNREVVHTDDIEVEVLIPGRAMLLGITWREGQRLTVLNVYAPNDKLAQIAFWDKLHDAWGGGRARRKPDFMMGDFNAVEDPIDRAPARRDDARVVNSMRDARTAMGLVDAWRHTHASVRRFTFSSHRHSLSRIDRICAKQSHVPLMFEWDTSSPPVRTDHRMLSVNFAPEDSPEMGTGRWTWPKALLTNKALLAAVVRRAEVLELALEDVTQEQGAGQRDVNPQTLWHSFKQDITDMAKKLARVELNRIKNKIRQLQATVSAKENEPGIDESDQVREEAASMREEYESLLLKDRANRGIAEKVNWMSKGEVVAPYWMRVGAKKAPREQISRLKVPESNPPVYVRKSSEIAATLRGQFDGVQRPREDTMHTAEERRTAVNDVLDAVPESQKLGPSETLELEGLLEEKAVRSALRSMPGGRASGMDGIPYEIYKYFDKKSAKAEEQEAERNGDRTVNIVRIMTKVFNDVQIHGIDARTEFNIGWICPLYKKKDRADPANYRPITLLNSDYKIMTKALTMCIAKVVCKMIDPDQAGFVPGRLIFDHVRLSKAMIQYAEAYEENGIIVALDQEKAYDRIRHDYLWQAMDIFSVPKPWITTIQRLYAGAKSVVIANGVISESFDVTRGVRQGDPLSCLLFDIAIEPLACALRKDETLTGYKVPGGRRNVLVNLFADDTLVYLNASDKYSDLLRVLRKWCTASGAKFNEGKTEIVPIGTPGFREYVATERRLHDNDIVFDESITVTPDGHTIRSLGARIGNDGNEMEPWSVVLDKIQADLDRWQASHPTMDGKKHIVQFVVGGKTQYLTKVQGMPKTVEDQLEKMIKGFIWPDKKIPPIALKQLYRPKEDGGLGLMDVRARNLAIEGTWIKSYLDLTTSRPMWATVTDAILRRAAPDVPSYLRTSNMYLQKWKVPKKGPKFDALPDDIRSMLKAAQKLQVAFGAVKMSENLKRQMPAWGHAGAPGWTYYQDRDECLGERHAVETIGDLLDVSQRSLRVIEGRRHVNRQNCACRECATDRMTGCENPDKCCRTASLIINKIGGKFDVHNPAPSDGLTLTHRRNEKNARAIKARRGLVTFDPSVTVKNTLSECVRFFVDPLKLSDDPAHRLVNPVRGLNLETLRRVVYTDGSCTGNGTVNAVCGAGVWFGRDDPRNVAARIPGPLQSNQVGEIAATIIALQKTPPEVPITIRTDSLYVMDGMTRFLGDWEDRGWVRVKNAELFKSLAYQLRRRTAQTDFEKVKAHSGEQGNEGADELAKRGAEKPEPDALDLSIDPAFDIQGIRIARATQKLLTQAVVDSQPAPLRRRTERNMQRAELALQSGPYEAKPRAAIWKSMRHKDIRKNIGQFLFQTAHGAQKIGNYWKNIPDYEDRARCQECGSENESMEHILVHCPRSVERKTIWRLARSLWEGRKGPHEWPSLSLGLIIACGAIQLEPEMAEDKPKGKRMRTAKCASRLLRIILSESAQLIWALRCERVIQEKRHSPTEVENRWRSKIQSRLFMDRTRAIKVLRTERSQRLLRDTWRGTVRLVPGGHGHTRGDWASDLGVLVGIRRPVPPRFRQRGER
jgi:ribonuclease HI/exonuclease III